MARFIYNAEYGGRVWDVNFCGKLSSLIDIAQGIATLNTTPHNKPGFEYAYRLFLNKENFVFLGIKKEICKAPYSEAATIEFQGREEDIQIAKSQVLRAIDGLVLI